MGLNGPACFFLTLLTTFYMGQDHIIPPRSVVTSSTSSTELENFGSGRKGKHVISPLCPYLEWHKERHILVHGIHIEIAPERFDKVKDDAISFSCTPDGKDKLAEEILLLELFKDGKPIASVRHGSKVSVSDKKETRLVAEGHIDKDIAQSFLTLTLKKPQSKDTGVYACVVYLLDETDTLKEERDKKNLSERAPDMKSLITVLNHLKDKIKDNEMNNKKLNKDLNDLKNSDSATIMDIEVTRKNLSQQMSDLKEKASFTSAFSATNKRRISASNGQVLILPDVIMKQGGGYNESTGIFVSPRDGLYAFHAVITNAATNSRSNYQVYVDVKKNDEVIARLDAMDSTYRDQSSVSSVVNLKTGDKVFLVMRFSYGSIYEDMYTVFTGYLIHTF